jgi:hypothetical protein
MISARFGWFHRLFPFNELRDVALFEDGFGRASKCGAGAPAPEFRRWRLLFVSGIRTRSQHQTLSACDHAFI